MRPCSPVASYTPSHAQAHSWMQCTWQRHTSLPGAFLSWVLCAHQAPSREQPAAMATQNQSTHAATGTPGRPQSLAALPAADSHLPLWLLPIPLKRQPCVRKPATHPTATVLGMGRRHGHRYEQASSGKSLTMHSQSNPVSKLSFYSFHPHFVLGSKKGRREEICLDGNLHAASVYILCS